MSRPGTRLRAVARRICSASAMDRLIDPAVADLQHEHADAIQRGRMRRAQWLLLTGHLVLCKVTTIAATRHVLHERRSADDRAVVRMITFSLVAMLAFTMLFIAPPLLESIRYAGGVAVAVMPRLLLYLIPQALAVALPLGVLFGTLFGLRDRLATVRVRWTIAGVALGGSAAAFVLVAWVLPEANQSFRELSAQGRFTTLARGNNELTPWQLAANNSPFLLPVLRRRLAYELHSRLALSVASLAFGLLALGLTVARQRVYGMLATGAMGLAIAFGYYVLMYEAREVVYFSEWSIPGRSQDGRPIWCASPRRCGCSDPSG